MEHASEREPRIRIKDKQFTLLGPGRGAGRPTLRCPDCQRLTCECGLA